MTILESYIGKLYMDYAFAILLILQFLLSTTTNPLVILMKKREKSFTSKMFIFLGFLCFTSNIYRAPKVAYIHFQQKKCVDKTPSIPLYIETVHFCFVTSATTLILLIIPVTRFIKTIRPFQAIKKKFVFTFSLLYMCSNAYSANVYSIWMEFFECGRVVSVYNSARDFARNGEIYTVHKH